MLYDRFDCRELMQELSGIPMPVQILDSVDSTNNEAKRYALDGGTAPCAFLAEQQTAGRGRMGRHFFSPDGVGIYVSLLLPIEGDLSDAVLLTTAAAVATRRAIARVTGIEVCIKWVNDLYWNARKVCGILAESFLAGQKRYAVLGVGINLYPSDLPDELRNKAGSLLSDPKKGLRNMLAAKLISELYNMTMELKPEAFIEEYRSASLVLGQVVTYTQNGVSHTGIAETVDERGRLWVRLADGTLTVLAGGEISLQLCKEKGKERD